MAQYQSSLTGPEIDAALTDMAQHDSEAWAVGTRDGSAVTSLDITYENNAKYYSDNAMGAAARAEAAVPAGTAGAVFFDQAQTLSDSQKQQARDNIGAKELFTNVLQLSGNVAIGSARIPPISSNAQIGWYRIADIDQTGVTNASYRQIFIMSGGRYSSYSPTEFALVASLPTFNSNSNIRVTQLSGHVGQTYTQIRFTSDSAVMHIEMYLSRSGSGIGNQEFFIASVGGTLKTYEPTEPISTTPATVNYTYSLQTTTSGAVQTA